MQMSIPAITSNATSTAEISGGAAYIVEPNKPGDIAEAMDTLAKNDTLHAELAQECLTRSEFFSPKRHLERLESGYRQVLGR